MTGRIYCETIEVSGFEAALFGMRAPMQSYERLDSQFFPNLEIGENDLRLAQKLIRGGSEHCKFLRMIHVQAEIAMPRYIWSELDTYKVATAANSESTMHRLLNNNRPIDESQFYFGTDPIISGAAEELTTFAISALEILRKLYKNIELTEEEKTILKILFGDIDITIIPRDSLLMLAKRILPECFIQIRYWDANYQTLRAIYHQRKHHRLKEEWSDVICSWIESLPYAKELICND